MILIKLVQPTTASTPTGGEVQSSIPAEPGDEGGQ